MGIKHLWTILTPFCERKPLYELQRKTVAVDLSCWICEAQNIAEYQVQPRMYLRNLYFRTCYLLLMEVNPVFVLEGKAPELKYQTIAARNEIQFKGAKPKTDGVKTGKDRTRFHFILRQCEEMLGYMGLVCIKGKGEAESMCAYLKRRWCKLVDGCISQDSDCFAYGAKVVYRNFSISTQGAYSSSGGAVDIYDITKAHKSLNFGRNKIIAMALLCGSDYCEGVQGIGKESALKFFENLTDEETLDRLRSWRLKPDLYEKFESQISDKNICSSCGHQGRIQSHTKHGCNPCGTSKGCDPFQFKEQRLCIKNEISMRNKALQDPNFPNENLIKEYLLKKDNVSELNLKWKQPDLVNFIVKIHNAFFAMGRNVCIRKILPILTRWQCLNHENVRKQTNIKGILYPDRIKKARNPKGIPSYEIIWTDPNEYFKNLIPEGQLMEKNVDPEKLWSTIEPQDLVEKAYPELVRTYKQSKVKPKKVSKRNKKDVTVDDIEGMLKNTSISQPAPKKTRKPKAAKKISDDVENRKSSRKGVSKFEDEHLKKLENSFGELRIDKPKQNTLDNFLKTAVMNNHKQKAKDKKMLEDEIVIGFKDHNCQTSTPRAINKNKNLSFDLNMSNFGDEDDSNLSDIVENIISRKMPQYVEDNIKKIPFDIAEVDININYENSSSFFITNPIENDLFEQTLNMEDDESTEEYECDENNLNNSCDKQQDDEELQENIDEENESFCDKYIPLYERLKKK
ncbi:hypothetical protein NQ318_016582 [Aromia moschata]|uniref:Flap endonuclease GEN n=1 Tax=Aromia moschata TaxID=1265417 RepID=A0AAV8YXR7_9CUCU|nr:hypothetical protein NQ318_016582 [Aromia moschata]